MNEDDHGDGDHRGADLELADDRNDEASPSRPRLVLVGLVILVVGILIGHLTAPDGKSTVKTLAAESAPGALGSTTPGTQAFPSGDRDRRDFWAVVGLEPAVFDDFDRPGNALSLGKAGSGQSWERVAGYWGINDGVAVRTADVPGLPSLTVVPQAKGDGLVEVTMSTVEPGAGLVFRYVDPGNYWSVTTDPALGTWKVARVVDGKSELVTEFSAPSKGGTTITVTLNGPLLRFLVEAVEYFQISDQTFEGQLQAGLVSPPDSTGKARWDRFLTMTTTSGSDSPPVETDDTASNPGAVTTKPTDSSRGSDAGG